MKALILVLALLPSLASGATLLEAKQTPVGQIELTDETAFLCDETFPLYAVVTDPDQKVSQACYTLTGNTVEVRWVDGVIAAYPLKLFKKA